MTVIFTPLFLCTGAHLYLYSILAHYFHARLNIHNIRVTSTSPCFNMSSIITSILGYFLASDFFIASAILPLSTSHMFHYIIPHSALFKLYYFICIPLFYTSVRGILFSKDIIFSFPVKRSGGPKFVTVVSLNIHPRKWIT